MLAISLQVFAQQSVKKSITGANGITNFQTTLNADQQVNFAITNTTSQLGLDAHSSLLLSETQKDALGFTHYRYQQMYASIPVENAMYIIHTQNNKIAAATGFIVTDFASDMAERNKSTLTGADAIKAAITYTHAEQYMWQVSEIENELKTSSGNKNATNYPTVSKVWYNAGEQLNPTALRLAYKVDIYSAKPFARAYYFIDAQTDKVLGKKDRLCTADAVGTANTLYCGSREIHSTQVSTNLFKLEDYSRGKGIVTVSGSLNGYGKGYTNTTANWNLKMPNRNAMDAHWGVEQTYDYYKIKFNRNSYDNQGSILKSYVNYFLFNILTNASWDGNSMQYGQRFPSSNGVTAIDVTGHELTHGVTQSSSNLNYNGETGGMNEAMSDIFGKSIQFYARPDDINWQIGNEMNWIIRDMSNPNAFQQPDTYNGTYWKANADVHILSGVGNYFYYLLVTGGTGTNDIGNTFTVKSIGIDKAAAILYRSNTVYLTPTSTYADWRTACISAATDLYGANSNAVMQVKNAWYAVGVGTAAANFAETNTEIFVSNITAIPNPVIDGHTTISYSLFSAGNVILKLADASGNIMQVLNTGKNEVGINRTTITLPKNLQRGYYYVLIEKDGIAAGKVKLLLAN